MDYRQEALSTETKDIVGQAARLAGNELLLRLLHASMGLGSESGEIESNVKAHIFYGRELDIANLIEEAGDCYWFLELLCDALKITREEVMARNVAKLRERFPDKFTEYDANNRNLIAERKVLEMSNIELAG